MFQVDIVIPSYRPLFFEQALRSAIGQTYPRVSIYVSDNCPTAEIEEICSHYRMLGVHYERSQDMGASNYVHACRLGDGVLIKPLLDDDILHPFCIERMVRVFGEQLAQEKVGTVFSASAVIDTRNKVTTVRNPFRDSGLVPKRMVHSESLGRVTNFFGELSSVLFTRRHFELMMSIGGMKWRSADCTSANPDFGLFLNSVELAPAGYISEVLSYFRRSAEHISDSNPSTNPKFHLLHLKWFELLRQVDFCSEVDVVHYSRIIQFINQTTATFSGRDDILLECERFRVFMDKAVAEVRIAGGKVD